jgi:Uma2 family endonuclease
MHRGAATFRPIDYPESDGKPMAESDRHRDEMVEAIAALEQRYHEDPEVYVSGNLLFYYEEGDPTARFSPDVFVVFGVPKGPRRTYKLWEEKRAPAFVLEVTSRETRIEDKGNKRELCLELGVSEYFLFDPYGEYLRPPLQGFRLRGSRYEPIAANAAGRLSSETLGLHLGVEDERLRFTDSMTGEPLLRIEELMSRADRMAKRADEAAAARAAAEAEIARLRALLEKK